ncbi:hypothetical protein PSPO01_15528 [Paraphaeosphaeria sporulosa]
MRCAIISAALAALSGGVVANTCTSQVVEGFVVYYKIAAQGVPDIPGVCGGLWDNLKQFSGCIGVGSEKCEANEAGDLVWEFSDGTSCDDGMIEATWYDATQNQWGAIECAQID